MWQARIATAVFCALAGAAFLIARTNSGGSAATLSPPPDTSRDLEWRWTAATAGGNVYIAYRDLRSDGALVSAWVDRRYADNQAGIGQDLLELRQFDCSGHKVRRLLVARQFRSLDGHEQRQVVRAPSTWIETGIDTEAAKLLLAACGRYGSS